MTNFILSFLNNIFLFQDFIPEGYSVRSEFIKQSIADAELSKITIEL